MSYIDSYKHQIIGLFGHLPIYQPQEDIEGSDDPEDFRCTTQQLVLGGGSGEHMGLVLQSPASAVAEFLLNNPELEFPSKQESELFQKRSESEVDFVFSGWTTQTHHDFYNLCTKQSLPNPYSPDGPLNFESWLLCGFGEFVFYSMPELAADLLGEILPLPKTPDHIHFNNILLIPPGMPVYANAGNAFFPDQSPA